jgi:hypothetical protein
MLDVRTGRYDLTPRAPRRICSDRNLERPVRKGRLDGKTLETIRAAYLRAVSERLTSEICLNGGRPPTIVISNGGTPILLVTSGRRTDSAPDNLSCWSGAATALSDLLEQTFPDAGQR